jgi:ADP-heptose:LPS heptosyltransferase
VIGLSWVSKAPVGGASKSARLADFEALLRLPGCRFVDLQYGDTGEERAALARDLGIVVERLGDIDNTNDLDGLAALMSACDAVVTVSNTTAHLAGALGRPTFVMVPHGFARIWYWFHDRGQSPWYPRVAVRRQQGGQPWADVVAAVAREVSALVDSTRG